MLKFCVLVAVLAWAGGAAAADQPRYVPVPAWVKPTPIPKDATGSNDASLQVRLQDNQILFGSDEDQLYGETAYKILSAQALSAAGNIILSWKPDTETLDIHRVSIIRGGQVIDALANGKAFTVIRRETSLEMAMLDGALTATMQLEGLQVGDVVDMAVTLHRKDPVFQGRSETFAAIARPGLIGRFHVREVWPASKPTRWRATDGVGAPAVSSSAGSTELLVDLSNIEAPKPPRDAPSRFDDTGFLETSQFQSWAEVSSLMAPLYVKASTLGPNSALRAEVEKIKAGAKDPKARALAALRLVQDQTRYTLLGMNNGGYVPADADTTWSRRFGDCKGKTALLLALLKALDIDAQPALVNTVGGDGLGERLPVLEAFDHILVRARIAGKVYWLDGTRLGDRDLDRIPVPNFHWALPVQAAGAALVKIEPLPFVEPQFERVLKLDSSAGIDHPAMIHAEQITRGDTAIAMNIAMSALNRADTDHYLREYWRGNMPWAEAKTVSFVFDDVAGTATLSMDGQGTMSWGAGHQFDIVDSNLGFDTSYKREPGPDTDAPYAVNYPTFNKWITSIVLPKSGANFRLLGADDIDQTTAGVEYKRQSRLANDVVTMEASERSVQPEFPAKEADAASVALRKLSAADVVVFADLQVTTNAPDLEQLAKPTDAAGFARRGTAFLYSGDYASAIADFTTAVNLEPTVAKHVYNRGVAHFQSGQLDMALADFNQALKLNPNDVFALVARGKIYLSRRDPSSAQADFDKAIRISPGDTRVLSQVAKAFGNAGESNAQLRFLDQAVRQATDKQPLASELNNQCWELAMSGQQLASALADCDASLKLKPDSAGALDSRALVLFRLGRFSDAIADYNTGLKLQPQLAHLLYGRGLAKLRLGMTADGRADISAAEDIEPSIDSTFAGYGLRP